MELIDIVDENGKFTGEVMDKEKAHDENFLHNEVAILLINNRNQVLLQKRSPNKRFDANKWALCAGHVDSKESLEHAIIRETKEEIGVAIKPEQLHTFSNREITIKKTNSHITYFYYATCNLNEKDFKIQEEELSEVKWFDIQTVINMIKSHDDTIVFKENRIKLFEDLLKLSIK